MTGGPVRICACGHDEDAHEHWRAGRECAVCGPSRCPAFRVPDGPPPVSPELRRLLGVGLGVPAAIVVAAAVASLVGGDAVPVAVAVLIAVVAGLSVWWLIRPSDRDGGGG